MVTKRKSGTNGNGFKKLSREEKYAVVEKEIIGALDDWQVPWHRAWGNMVNGGVQTNPFTGTEYKGLNLLNTTVHQAVRGYQYPYWITANQAIKLGCTVPSGKGIRITKWFFPDPIQATDADGQPLLDANGQVQIIKRQPTMNLSVVWNIAEVQGEFKLPKKFKLEPPKKFNVVKAAEKIAAAYLANSGPSLSHDGGERGYFVPKKDEIHMPTRESFDSPDEYYSTLFHEMGHSTGHESRLNRRGSEVIRHFGDEAYGLEELTAEFTSAFVAMNCGVDTTIKNSTAYIKNWSEAIKANKGMVIDAAGKAQKAADYILGRKIEAAAK